MKHDIQNLQDIQQLVDTFYGSVQKDQLIGGIFMGVIKDWPTHLQKMHRFWQTILLDDHTYQGNPFPPHAQMPLTAAHFNRWLELWNAAIDGKFEGEKATEAKDRGKLMAKLFLSKIEFYRDNNRKPLV